MKTSSLWRKMLSLTLAFLLAVSLIPTALCAEPGMDNFSKTAVYPGFSDIPESAWYYKNVRSVCEMGLMNGKSSGAFDPGGQLTVAEAITLAVRVATTYYGIPFTPGGTPWYSGAVAFAEEYQIIAEGQFSRADYNRPVTRAEFAALLFETLPLTEFERINRITYIPDLTVENPSWNEIYMLYNAGVLTGKGTLVNGELSGDTAGSFFPNDPISRSEAAAIIDRVALPDKRVAFSLSSHRPGQVIPAADGSFRISIPKDEGWEVPLNEAGDGSGVFYCRQEDSRTEMRVITVSREGYSSLTSQDLADQLIPKYIQEWWDGVPETETSEEAIVRGLLSYTYDYTYTKDGEAFGGMALSTQNSDFFYIFFLTWPEDDPDDQYSKLAGLLLSFDMAL